MIIYSIEITIHNKVEKKWLNWMQSKHIPDLMRTNLFNNCHILKDLNKQQTYIIQYELSNMSDYLKYEKLFADNLQKEHSLKFKNKFTANRTICKKVQKISKHSSI